MYGRYIKRPIDTVAAVTILVVLFPAGVITAIIIRVSSGTPILIRQKRNGLGGDEFTLYKYRTMTSNNSVYDTTTENQMTTVGKYVRALSLDEVPQLINIIKGEMSFIGPRPWIPEYYAAMTPTQRKRCDVLPGITGLAQVKGRNSLSVHDKINYDLHYVDNISLREDVKVIFLTAKAVFDKGSAQIAKSGIHQEIEALKTQMQFTTPAGSSQQTAFYTELQTGSGTSNRITRKVDIDKQSSLNKVDEESRQTS